MLNLDLLGRRLRQYSAAWLAAFLLVLVGDLAAGMLMHMAVTDAANLFLTAALAGLAVAFALFIAVTVAAPESAVTKFALLVLGIALLLPLLWAPVLGAIASAFFGHVSIEYSSAYANFRVVVGRVIYTLMALFTRNPYIDAGIAMFQNIAVVVGFAAAVVQLWQTFVARRSEAEG
jgi:hypothetical protein